MGSLSLRRSLKCLRLLSYILLVAFPVYSLGCASPRSLIKTEKGTFLRKETHKPKTIGHRPALTAYHSPASSFVTFKLTDNVVCEKEEISVYKKIETYKVYHKSNTHPFSDFFIRRSLVYPLAITFTLGVVLLAPDFWSEWLMTPLGYNYPPSELRIADGEIREATGHTNKVCYAKPIRDKEINLRISQGRHKISHVLSTDIEGEATFDLASLEKLSRSRKLNIEATAHVGQKLIKTSVQFTAAELSMLLDRKSKEYAYISAGNDYFNQGNYDRAIEQYKKALEINPQSVQGRKKTRLAYQKKDLVKRGSLRPLLICSCQIRDANKNGILDAGESATMIVTIKNEGKGEGKGIKVKISGFEDKRIRMPEEQTVGDIPPNQCRNTYFSIKVAKDIKDTVVLFRINVTERYNNNPKALLKKVRLKGKVEDLEYLEYVKVKKKKNIEVCLRYISKFPQGKHRHEVQDLLEDLRWKRAISNNAIKAFKKYLQFYPNGKYEKVARKKIEEFQAIAEAKKSDTLKSYREFAEKFPKSRWAPTARRRTTLKYWQQKRLSQQPNSSHILCQVAKAIIEERGEVGYGEAKKYYRQAIQVDDNEQAYIGLAKLLLFEENYSTVQEYLKQALSKGHNNYKIFYYYGKACEGLEDIETAIMFYSRAIKEKPDFIECLYSRAILYRMIPQLENARRDFEKIIKIAPPNSSYAESAREYLNRM